MATNNLPGETGLRHVWLAGLGVVSVVRREALNANDRAVARTARLQRRALGLAKGIQSQLMAGADRARNRLEPIVAKVNSEFGLRIAPTLAKLGLRPAQRAGRKPAARTKRRAASGQQRRSTRKA